MYATVTERNYTLETSPLQLEGCTNSKAACPVVAHCGEMDEKETHRVIDAHKDVTLRGRFRQS